MDRCICTKVFFFRSSQINYQNILLFIPLVFWVPIRTNFDLQQKVNISGSPSPCMMCSQAGGDHLYWIDSHTALLDPHVIVGATLFFVHCPAASLALVKIPCPWRSLGALSAVFHTPLHWPLQRLVAIVLPTLRIISDHNPICPSSCGCVGGLLSSLLSSPLRTNVIGTRI